MAAAALNPRIPVPIFTGNKGEEVIDFIQQYTATANINGWNAANQLRFLPVAFLKSPDVLSWWNNLVAADKATIAAAFASLRRDYLLPNQNTVITSKIQNRYQGIEGGRYESVDKFFRALTTMNARLPVADQYTNNMLKDLFIEHLALPLRAKVHAMNPPPANPAQALQYARQAERAEPDLVPTQADYERLRLLTMATLPKIASVYSASAMALGNVDTPMTTEAVHTPLVRASDAFQTPLQAPSVAPALYTTTAEKPVTLTEMATLMTQLLKEKEAAVVEDRKRARQRDDDDDKPEPPAHLKEKAYYTGGRTNKHKRRVAPPPPVNDHGYAFCATCGQDNHVEQQCPQNRPMCRICLKPHRGRCFQPCDFCGRTGHRPADCWHH